jgi:hypothetical protein
LQIEFYFLFCLEFQDKQIKRSLFRPALIFGRGFAQDVRMANSRGLAWVVALKSAQAEYPSLLTARIFIGYPHI